MSQGEERVIVSVGATAGLATVHHRDFPEIRAQGDNPSDAAVQLLNHLTRALDSALTEWRRDSIVQAIDDVKAYTQQAKV